MMGRSRGAARTRSATWSAAFAAIAGKLKGANPARVGAVAGDLASVEEMFALKDLMTRLGSKNIDSRQDGEALDPGAGATTNEPMLRGGFKVPSLRNVALTAPYGHAGQFATLRETVAFYTRGRGHAVPRGEQLRIHWHIWEPKLSDQELDRLVDFLGALTDESFRPTTPAVVPSGLPVPH